MRRGGGGESRSRFIFQVPRQPLVARVWDIPRPHYLRLLRRRKACCLGQVGVLLLVVCRDRRRGSGGLGSDGGVDAGDLVAARFRWGRGWCA